MCLAPVPHREIGACEERFERRGPVLLDAEQHPDEVGSGHRVAECRRGCEAEARAGTGSTSQAAGDLLAVLREVASDDAEVEARQDGTRRLSLQQETEGLGDELAGSGIRRQCADVILGDGHVVAASADSYGAAKRPVLLARRIHLDLVTHGRVRFPRAPVSASARCSSVASRRSVRSNAAQTASLTTVRSRPRSSWYSASAEVPPGEVTMSRSSATCLPLARANAAEPCMVSSTSSRAT